MAELKDENFERAISLFEKLQSRYPYGRYAEQALLEQAYANYRFREPEAAVSAADRFIKQFPNHPNIDYAYYVKGLANFPGHRTTEEAIGGQDMTERDPQKAKAAFEDFRLLVNRFPNSRYVEDSTVRMRYLVNALARYELHVARYYQRRGAMVAAINRARQVLEDYPTTPATREALEIMAQGYDAMGMTELRDDARRVLAQNRAKVAANAPAEASWWQFWK